MALYFGLAIAAPLAHAKSEVLSSRPEVEARHTQLCARIHSEAMCLVGVTFQALAPLPRALAVEGSQRSRPTARGRETWVVLPEASSRHLVRAPPAS